MAGSPIALSRRAIGGAAALGLVSTPVSAAEMPSSTQEFRDRFPALAKNEGVWDGMFRRVDADGRITAEFKSRIIKRYLPDETWPDMYHQTNIYNLANGERQQFDTKGWFADGKIHFSSDRVDGWQMDDPADSFQRTVFLYMVYKSNLDQYVYEMINVSDDGRYRTRMTQFLKDGQTVRRTLIDEELVSRDWTGF